MADHHPPGSRARRLDKTNKCHRDQRGLSQHFYVKQERRKLQPSKRGRRRRSRWRHQTKPSARLSKRQCKTRESSPMRSCCSKPSNFHRNSKVSTRERSTNGETLTCMRTRQQAHRRSRRTRQLERRGSKPWSRGQKQKKARIPMTEPSKEGLQNDPGE